VGCDECQLCCPHNAHATATVVEDFALTDAVENLTRNRVNQMTSGDFRRTFAHSAIARLRAKTLRRNANLNTPSQHTTEE
jgi:epoxyqueuosine reductase QueG